MAGAVWFEIYVRDLYEASSFYARLGWNFSPLSDYSDDYWTVEPGSRGIGGALVKVGTQLPDDVAPSGTTIIYSEVSDLSSSIEESRALGAIVEKSASKITDKAGYFAIVRTPEGALFGYWSSRP